MAGRADVKYRPDLITPQDIVGFIEGLGFGATWEKGALGRGVVELNVSISSRIC